MFGSKSQPSVQQAQPFANRLDNEYLRQLSGSFNFNRWAQAIFILLAVVIIVGAVLVFGRTALACLKIIDTPGAYDSHIVTSAFDTLTGSLLGLGGTIISAALFAGLRGKIAPNFTHKIGESDKQSTAATALASAAESPSAPNQRAPADPASKPASQRLSRKQAQKTPMAPVSATSAVGARYRPS